MNSSVQTETLLRERGHTEVPAEKICHISSVHNALDPRIFFKECSSLARKYQVSYIARHNKEESINNVRIIPFPALKPRFFRVIFSPAVMFFYARRERAAVYHFHDPELLIIAPVLKFFLGCKTIYDVHEDYYTSIRGKRYLCPCLSKIISSIYRKIERFFARTIFDEVIIAEKYYREFIPNSVEILNYPLKRDYPEKSCSRETERIRLLYTGNVSISRGALICANITNFVKNCEVTFVGKCKKNVAEEIYNTANAQENIKITGIDKFIRADLIDKFYKKGGYHAGLAIFPYSDHYFKKELTKFFEYMGAGLPIIASDFPVWKKLIEDNECGVCVDPGDAGQIENAVKYIFGHPEAAERMGENGKRAIDKKYRWEKEERKLFELYENLLRPVQ